MLPEIKEKVETALNVKLTNSEFELVKYSYLYGCLDNGYQMEVDVIQEKQAIQNLISEVLDDNVNKEA